VQYGMEFGKRRPKETLLEMLSLAGKSPELRVRHIPGASWWDFSYSMLWTVYGAPAHNSLTSHLWGKGCCTFTTGPPKNCEHPPQMALWGHLLLLLSIPLLLLTAKGSGTSAGVKTERCPPHLPAACRMSQLPHAILRFLITGLSSPVLEKKTLPGTGLVGLALLLGNLTAILFQCVSYPRCKKLARALVNSIGAALWEG